jgi:NADH:ubiquinone oxidoreductase subunit 2 (subunit N)
MFMAGSLLMEESTFWREVDRQRWLGGALAIISFLVVAAAVVAVPREDWPDAVVVLVRIARSIFQWCAIIALLGFAGRIANRPNRVIAFLNRSMMTYYVAHQTVIIIVAHQISKMGPLDIRSFVPVVLLSTLGCGLIGEAQKLIKAFLSPLIARVIALIKPPLKTAPSGAAAD